jgi:osmoprotectant transport system permease protein
MNWIRPELARDIPRYFAEHALLVSIAIACAAALGIPLGILASRAARIRPLILAVSSLFQTIPGLALLGFLIPVSGIGKTTAILALILYALLPLLQNTLAGITSIDPRIRESAVAMGMTARQILLEVELPLAAPQIIAGFRIALVSTIGAATIAAAIGGGGLGVLIFQGVASVDSTRILAGAVPAAALALLCEGGLTWFEKRLRTY